MPVKEKKGKGARRWGPSPGVLPPDAALDDRAKETTDYGGTPHGHRTPERDSQSPPRERSASKSSRYPPEHEEEPQGHPHYARRQDPCWQRRGENRRWRRPYRKGGR